MQGNKEKAKPIMKLRLIRLYLVYLWEIFIYMRLSYRWKRI